eukprot:jgi/Botrbrau1/21355/Bobra.0184s0064.1
MDVHVSVNVDSMQNGVVTVKCDKCYRNHLKPVCVLDRPGFATPGFRVGSHSDYQEKRAREVLREKEASQLKAEAVPRILLLTSCENFCSYITA